MAIVSRSSSRNWLLGFKILLNSIGVCSLALIFKQSLPVISEFLVSRFPLLWSSFRSWLTPPYLYFIINGIIITIAASSRCRHRVDEKKKLVVPAPVKLEVQHDFAIAEEYDAEVLKDPVGVAQLRDYDAVDRVKDIVEDTQPSYGGLDSAVMYEQKVKSTVVTASEEYDDDNGFTISRSTPAWQAGESTDIPVDYSFPMEKPLVSIRFGHRKNVKSSSEAGSALRVAKLKRNDTLENTWKTIMDGRPMPLTRHLKKSDTFDMMGRRNSGNSLNSGPQEESPGAGRVTKPETFQNRGNNTLSLSPSPVSGRLRREPSPGQDELNRRVEAFIKKFNEDMRLQRQESLNQYLEMINRGAGP